MDTLFDVSGKVAMITGGSRGLGRAMSLAFAERGAKVAIVSRKLDACEALAAEIAAASAPVSVALVRQMLWRMLGADHPMAAHRIDSRGVYSTGRSADAREGVLSFLEKRPPTWTGRVSTDLPEWYPWWDEPPFS